MTALARLSAGRNEPWLVGAMLLLLHYALWWDFGSPLSQSLLLAHLGLFFIWQPIWRTDARLRGGDAAVFLLFTVGFFVWLDWWLICGWIVLLIGLVSGRALTSRAERYLYLATLLFLTSELLIRGVTQAFEVQSLPRPVNLLFQHGLQILPLCMLLIPRADALAQKQQPVDFFRALNVSLITAMLAAGSLLNMYHTGTSYPEALLQSLLGLAAFLVAISWLLSPRRGIRSLIQLWERSLLNIGTPFEQWLSRLAQLTLEQQTPPQFLEAAMEALVDLPWVSAVQWRAPDSQGQAGTQSQHRIDLEASGIEFTVYARRRPGPTLTLHCKLLVQLVGYFYAAKQSEQELASRTHMQAVYETGARVTHDIKNLLQSLQTMTLALDPERAAELGVGRDPSRSLQLLARNLPHITQRLQLALDKLQAPQQVPAGECSAGAWWTGLESRYGGGRVKLVQRLDAPEARIPSDLFDSVVENLLENALHKLGMEPDLDILIELETGAEGAVLRVRDDGSAVPPDIAARLLRGPVTSATGLGIGLYQAARQAELLGYRLSLARNAPGDVCFELRPAAGGSTLHAAEGTG